MVGDLDDLQDFVQPFFGAEGEGDGQDRRFSRGTSLLKILMDLDKTGELFYEMILFTHHAWVLDFTFGIITLSSGLLGLFNTLLRRSFLVFDIVLLFTS